MAQIIDSSGVQQRHRWNALLAGCVIAFTILGMVCTLSQRYLFADGSQFFLNVVQHRTISDFFPARYYAHVLTQLPVVALLRDVHVRNINVAGITYGATLFLTPIAGLVLVWWAARKAPLHYLAFPMLSVAILYLTSSFVMFCEIHPATWLFWCLLYLLMFSERLTWFRSALLIVLGVLSTRTYENYLFLAWPLLYVTIRRGMAAKAAGRRAEVCVCAICGLIFVTSAAVALYSTMFPFDANNRQNFAKAVIDHLQYWPVRFSIVMLAGALWQIFIPQRELGDFFWIAAIAVGCFVVGAPLFGYQQPWTYQYVSRVQSLYIPLMFGSLVALNPPRLRNFAMNSADRQAGLRGIVAWCCVVSVLFQLGATWRWNNYRIGVVREVAGYSGGRIYAESPSRPKEFDWGWAMPSLSLLLGYLNGGTVSTIIPNPEPNGWQLFNPQIESEIPHLAEYGVQNHFEPVPKMEIVKAEYGVGENQRDVTEILLKHATGSHVITLPGSYNDSFGADPAPNVPKQLKIQYLMDDIAGEILLAENSPIRLPAPIEKKAEKAQ